VVSSPDSLQLTTFNLSEDLTETHADFGEQVRGDISADELRQLIDNFSRIDGVDNHTHEPRVQVRCAGGEFSVRLSTGKLYLYHTNDMTQPPAELNVDGLMAVFTGSAAEAAASDESETPLPSTGSKWRGVLALVMLALGLGLTGRALFVYFEPAPTWPPVIETQVITDPGTLAQYETQLPGIYTTGTGAGQRAIVLGPGNTIVFQLFGGDTPGTIIRESQDSYLLGKREQNIHLITTRFGDVEVRPDGVLFYSGDLYGREQVGE